MATVPFPEAAVGPLIFILLGFLTATTTLLGIYVYKLRDTINQQNESKINEININQLRLSKSTHKILEEVIEEPQLQSDLPSLTNVSKATVSNSIKELKQKNYIKRKKRGNTYLIEPDMKKLEEKCSK